MFFDNQYKPYRPIVNTSLSNECTLDQVPGWWEQILINPNPTSKSNPYQQNQVSKTYEFIHRQVLQQCVMQQLFFMVSGIQHSSDYKLQYISPTIHININTIRIIQSVISVSQINNPIAPIIIVVIAIAANNFIRSITLYRLRNKPINLCFRIVIVQAFSPELLVDCTLCFFLTGYQMFHKSFCQAMLLRCAFCKFLQLKVLSEIVAILKFSFLGFIAFQSTNITCLVLSFTSYPIND